MEDEKNSEDVDISEGSRFHQTFKKCSKGILREISPNANKNSVRTIIQESNDLKPSETDFFKKRLIQNANFNVQQNFSNSNS